MPRSPDFQPAPKRVPLRVRKRLRTQATLYDTAVRLISERGYDNVTVDDLCNEADVARATFFRYFGTKAGLMIEFDRRIVAEIETELARRRLSVAEKLQVVQTAMASAWTKVHPNLRKLGLDYLNSTAVIHMGVAVADIRNVTARIVQGGYDSGELRALLPAETIADLFVSCVRIGIYGASVRGPRSQIPGSTRPLVELFLHGLAKA